MSAELFDALDAAEIDGPEGRNEHISAAQFRKLTMFMSDETITRITGSLSGAFINPLWPPERAPRDPLEGLDTDPLDELVRNGALAVFLSLKFRNVCSMGCAELA